MDIKNDLMKNRATCLVFPVKDYPLLISETVKTLSENYSKILYVSLNRLYNPLKKKMQQDGIDVTKFLFVDCVTKMAVPQPEEHEDCIYVSAPNALTELSIAVTKTVQTHYPDIILFDSLSTLLIYENETVTSKFVHSITSKTNAFGINIAFTILDGDKEKTLIKDMNLLLDKIITIEPGK